jgi:hypothetical protein
MADEWKEGDTVTTPDGQDLTLTGGKWVPANGAPPPSTMADAAKATLPALERTGMALATVPNTAGKLVAQGVNAAGDYAFPDWKTSPPGKVMSAAENYFGAKDYTAGQKKVEDAVGPLYSAQTPGGKIWEGAAGALPLGAIGEGAMIPNMVRALASGGASEAAGQATQGTPWETPARMAAGAGTYGVTGAMQPARIIANTPRAAAAQMLENSGVPVSGADITGSRLMSTLEGQPPAGQTGAVSDAMKQQGGIVRPPGNTDQFSALVDARRNALQVQGNQLGAQTSIPATSQLRQQLAGEVQGHVGHFGGTSIENPAVTQGLNDYDQLTLGGAPLSGTQYQGLRQQWNGSGDPTLRRMAGHLDAAMDVAHPGVWDGWRQNWADYEGLKAASDALGGEATTKPLSPDQIVNTMHRRTPMRDTAEAAQTIQGARPQPYDFGTISKIGHVIGALGGVGGAYHGGSEQALAGAIVPEIVGQGLPAAISLTQPLFRSGAGQNFMRNLDPRVVSALLAQQGVRPKGSSAEQPQNAGQ